jgi:hypothetical protein
MSPARAVLVALLVLAAGAATTAGCGTDPPTRARGGRLDVALREFHLVPARAQAARGQLTIAARNDGTLVHQLAIGRGRYALAVTPALRPGQSAVLDVRLPPGSYRLFDPRSNYDTLGLYGSLVVR